MKTFEDIIDGLRRGDIDAADFVVRVEPYTDAAHPDHARFVAALDAQNVWTFLEADQQAQLSHAIGRTGPGPGDNGAGNSVRPEPTVTVMQEFISGDPDAIAGPDEIARLAERMANGEGAPANSVVLQGRFRLVNRIGSGGMSNVYRAIDLRRLEAGAPDPYIAVKILHLPKANERRSLRMLQQEVEKAQTLAHPNIVRVFDFDRDGEIVFMTMEHLDGNSLHSLIADRAFDKEGRKQAIGIIRAIAGALEFAHRNRIVHGDLKPANVFITSNNAIKIIDFGIARAFDPGEQRNSDGALASTAGTNGYTPAYTSPEKLAGGEAHPSQDVYALGCISYELLTGHHPFGKRSGEAAQKFGLEVRPDDALTPCQYRALRNALAFDPEERTASADAFVEELTREEPSNPWMLRLGAAAAAIVLSVLGFYFLESGPPAPPGTEVVKVAPPEPGTHIQDCAVCPPMVVTAAGAAASGSGMSGAATRPPLAIAVNETTVGEYGAFVARNGYESQGGCTVYTQEWHYDEHSSWRDPGFRQGSSHPVTCVSWTDARAYVGWLSEITGERYRLLNAGEWVGAARTATASSPCELGNVADQVAEERFPGWRVADCSDSYVFTAPVAQFAANELGLNDTTGNVLEWIDDCGPAGCETRQLRGGSWFSEPSFSQPDALNQFEPEERASTFGIRVAREISR